MTNTHDPSFVAGPQLQVRRGSLEIAEKRHRGKKRQLREAIPPPGCAVQTKHALSSSMFPPSASSLPLFPPSFYIIDQAKKLQHSHPSQPCQVSPTLKPPGGLPSLRLHSQAMFPQLREGNTNPRTKKPTKGDVSCSHCPGGEFLDLHCEREGMRSAKSSDICSVTSDRIPSAHPARAYPPVAPVRPRSLSASVPPCVPLFLSS